MSGILTVKMNTVINPNILKIEYNKGNIHMILIFRMIMKISISIWNSE